MEYGVFRLGISFENYLKTTYPQFVEYVNKLTSELILTDLKTILFLKIVCGFQVLQGILFLALKTHAHKIVISIWGMFFANEVKILDCT